MMVMCPVELEHHLVLSIQTDTTCIQRSSRRSGTRQSSCGTSATRRLSARWRGMPRKGHDESLGDVYAVGYAKVKSKGKGTGKTRDAKKNTKGSRKASAGKLWQ